VNGEGQRPPPHDCGLDAAAYALGAVSVEEAEAFRRHLEGCVVCRDEVASLSVVTDALALAAPQLPMPARLKRRVLSEVRRQAPRAEAAAVGSRRGRALVPRPAVAMAGALAAGAVAVAVVLAFAGSSGVRTVRASVAPPSASAVLRLASGHGELTLQRMPQPPAGKIYEVWLKRGAAPPAPTNALFGVTSAGAAAVVIPGNLRGVSEVLVTPEPRGGSQAPTHVPVIVARLS
jgi:anti-sigma-K factor RskA